jgi:predicted nucleic acid-binding protein
VLVAAERSYLGGNANAYAILPGEGLIAAITLAELWIGIHLADNATRADARRTELERIRARFDVVAFGEPEAEAHGRLFAQLRAAGRMIGERDLQIAATAIANGHDLITLNVREFERIPGLAVRTL